MGPSDKSAPKTWRNISRRKCSNATDLRHDGTFTAVVCPGMPMTFCTGTAHLHLCTAQSWDSPHKTAWAIDFSGLPAKEKKKSPSIPSDPLEFLSSLHLKKNKKNLNCNYFFHAYHYIPLLKSTKNESVLDTKNEQTPIPLKRDRQIHRTYWWRDFPSNLLAE